MFNTPLTKEQIRYVKRNINKMKQADIARKLQVTPTTINHLIKGKRGNFSNEGIFNEREFFSNYKY